MMQVIREAPGVVILNPVAGGGRAGGWTEGLRRKGHQVVETRAPGEGTELARKAAASGAPLVVAAGGDDTVREVIVGLLGSPAQLGILPLGTFNNMARSLGIPLDPELALTGPEEGFVRDLDLARVSGSEMMMESLGVGFDADAWTRAPREPPGKLRWLTGVRASFDSLLVLAPAEYRLEVDGRTLEVEATQITVANASHFASAIPIAPRARCDDGWLDVCIVPPMTRWEVLAAVPHFFTGRHLSEIPQVRYLRARKVVIQGPGSAPVRIDGKVQAGLPIEIEIMEGAIPVRVPESSLRADELMSSPAITVTEETSVQDVADLISERDVSGVIVVNEAGEAVGVISRGDLLHRVATPHLPPHIQLLGGVFYLDTPHHVDEIVNKIRGVVARDIMHDEVVSVSPAATAQEVADLMIEQDVNRVAVLEDGRPVGVISRGDVVRHCVARRKA